MSSSQTGKADQPQQPIGKTELLDWAEQISGIKCKDLTDLCNGVVYIKLFSKIWPKVVDLADRKNNWRVFRSLFFCLLKFVY